MQIPSSPKGTRDFYPDDMVWREHIFSSWESTCRLYGFEKYDGPMFEHLELFTKKSGDEIEKQLYAFADKAGRHVALRPEITPSLARMVAARGTSLKMPLRWYSIPTLFRYERMQKGRLREFAQLNMDILGVADVSADAELIAAAVAMMQALGFTHEDFSVRVSSRSLLEELFVSMGIAREKHAAVYAEFDKGAKAGPGEIHGELARLLGGKAAADKVLDVFAVGSLDELRNRNPGSQAVAPLVELFGLIDAYGLDDYVAFDLGIVRGLAYYTGIVFELFDKKRSLRSIAGGGRYDRLVGLYGGPDTPAVGFAAGDVVLAEMLKAKNVVVPRPPRSDVFVVSIGEQTPRKAVIMTQALRKAGVRTEFALREVGVGKQMKLAHNCRARLAVFVGGEEEKGRQVRIRDMDAGEEWLVSDGALVETVRDKLLQQQ
jgi:histidyl-tRNA synthetase